MSEKQFDLPLVIVGKLRALDREMQRYSTTVESQLGIKATDLWFMQILQRSPDLRLTEIADQLSILQGSASNSLERLVKAGYVLKTPDSKDKRRIHLSLTQQGLDLMARAPGNIRCPLRKAMKNWSVDALERLLHDLQTLLSDSDQINRSENAPTLSDQD